MTPFHENFYLIFGAGLGIAAIASIGAGMMRGLMIPAFLLIVGVLSCWAGLFLGLEIGYQQWQALPDPPAEAFADTFPMGALIAGWLPAMFFCIVAFGITRMFRNLLSKPNIRRERVISNVTPEETGNPYQAPNETRR